MDPQGVQIGVKRAGESGSNRGLFSVVVVIPITAKSPAVEKKRRLIVRLQRPWDLARVEKLGCPVDCIHAIADVRLHFRSGREHHVYRTELGRHVAVAGAEVRIGAAVGRSLQLKRKNTCATPTGSPTVCGSIPNCVPIGVKRSPDLIQAS
jgi:hypothetical protein